MRLGVQLFATCRDDCQPSEALVDSVELAVAADRIGYDSVWFAEHHRTPWNACSDPLTLAAHVAGRTSRIMLGTTIVNLTLHLDISGYGTDSPHRPDLVKHAIDRTIHRHGAVHERVIVVGDTPWDIEAARAHGAIAVGLATGAFSEEELHDVGAALSLVGLGTEHQRHRLYAALGPSVSSGRGLFTSVCTPDRHGGPAKREQPPNAPRQGSKTR